MPEVTIRAFASLKEIFGAENTFSVAAGATVYSCIEAFANASGKCGELFDAGGLKPHIILMYNRERIDAEDAKEIALSDGDEIVLYPPVSGG
ncbi:MAG TPA: MoaD/ThiS family protein [Methanocorpusculum sp.]|nr:MoaD/ThiS family protein [Methanocorpusculum sp.]